MQRIRTFILLALWLACQAAQAQWQWLDKDGRKVFSDRAPPSDIPARSILKQPGKALLRTPVAAPAPVAAASAADAPDSAAGAAPGTLQLSGHDKELEARKKQADADKAAKAKAEADQLASAKAANCTRARASQTLMNSGVRVSVTNAKGEREILDDDGRAAENKRIDALIAANCS